jgi:hypothetical protein
MAVIITGNNTPTAGGVTYGDGSTYANTAAGTAGQFLQSAGSGAPIWAAAGASVSRSTKTANYTLVAGDKGNIVSATANTFTFAFTAAATLGDGWFCYLQNSGTGDITLDPNASETIDGLTSYIMYPGETRLVQCTGTAFNTIIIDGFYATFTASGTFIKPPGYTLFSGLAWGGGGGGSRSSTYNGSGGGGGGCTPFVIPTSLISASETVTIAAGGNGASSEDTDASNGGNTTFNIVAAYGGGGGAGNSNGGAGGGVLGRADIYTPGIPYSTTATAENVGFGGAGIQKDSVYGGSGGGGYSNGAGGKSFYGGAGGGRTTAAAGTSVFGGNGGGGTNAAPAPGNAPGGGGRGSSLVAGSAGARGELRIWGIV